MTPDAVAPAAAPAPAGPLRRHLQGSGHCGALRVAITTDLPAPTTCDCPVCKRKNARMVGVHRSAFGLQAAARTVHAVMPPTPQDRWPLPEAGDVFAGLLSSTQPARPP